MGKEILEGKNIKDWAIWFFLINFVFNRISISISSWFILINQIILVEFSFLYQNIKLIGIDSSMLQI